MSQIPTEFSSFLVQQTSDGNDEGSLQTITLSDLPTKELTIQTEYSAINYKDALAATGHRGVIKKVPHVPGIDLVGKVVESKLSEYPVGSEVVSAGGQFGAGDWGAWSTICRANADELILLPKGIDKLDCIALGVAGFTAGQCINALIEHGLTPDSGPIVISGATGGVGILATQILSHLGFEVHAVTGKMDRTDWLKDLGATKVLDRNEFVADESKGLLSQSYAGAVDTVGGKILSTILKSTKMRGCVTACGLAQSPELNTNVYPFILRGVTLVGIDSAYCSKQHRHTIWNKLGTDWIAPKLQELVKVIPLQEAKQCVNEMLASKTFGRIVIDMNAPMN